MRRYGIVLVSAIGSFLSGCMVGPRYVKPLGKCSIHYEPVPDRSEFAEVQKTWRKYSPN